MQTGQDAGLSKMISLVIKSRCNVELCVKGDNKGGNEITCGAAGKRISAITWTDMRHVWNAGTRDTLQVYNIINNLYLTDWCQYEGWGE